MKYGAWKVYDGAVALGDLVIKTMSDKTVFAKGDYGVINGNHEIAIAGVCLFDTSWCVRFSTGGVRSIALPLDRERVEARIRDRGFEVVNIIFPTELTNYHKWNIDFVADTIVELQPKCLLYHVPVDEYNVYVQNLERLIGKRIPGGDVIINNLSAQIKEYFQFKMKKIGFDNFEFINPMRVGARTPNESYALPYAQPELFGATEKNIYAIEDLVEVKIAIEIERKLGRKVPVRFCVLGLPHPYMTFSKKNVLNQKGVVTISV